MQSKKLKFLISFPNERTRNLFSLRFSTKFGDAKFAKKRAQNKRDNLFFTLHDSRLPYEGTLKMVRWTLFAFYAQIHDLIAINSPKTSKFYQYFN